MRQQVYVFLSVVALFLACVRCQHEQQPSENAAQLRNEVALLHWKQHLPTVFVLPLKEKLLMGGENHSDVSLDEQHSQNVHFRLWLTGNHYQRLVHDGNRADLYFLPVQHAHFIQQKWWFEVLDTDIRGLPHYTGFALDRVFMAATHPFNAMQDPSNPKIRNVLDIRYLRSDNELSPNGREVFVPYVYPWRKWIADRPFNATMRENMMCVVCKEAGSDWDSIRHWRSETFNQWNNSQDSIVSMGMSDEEMQKCYLTSDFCVILPGDTTSTQKLYKAIFSNCIPVIFLTFPEQLPFYHFIDWSAFSIIVMKDVIKSDGGMDELRDLITAERKNATALTAYKTALYDVRLLFDYAKFDWPSVYHLTLLSLASSLHCKLSPHHQAQNVTLTKLQHLLCR